MMKGLVMLMCLKLLAQVQISGRLLRQSKGCSSICVHRRLVPWSDCGCKIFCYGCINDTHILGLACRLGCRVGMGSSRPGSLPALGRPHLHRGSNRRPRSHTLVHWLVRSACDARNAYVVISLTKSQALHACACKLLDFGMMVRRPTCIT